jgi:hypothetical protein
VKRERISASASAAGCFFWRTGWQHWPKVLPLPHGQGDSDVMSAESAAGFVIKEMGQVVTRDDCGGRAKKIFREEGTRQYPCLSILVWSILVWPLALARRKPHTACFLRTMVKGQKVVCINDTFNEFIRAIYLQLPVKGKTYTIREVFLGREKIVKGGESATVGILLEELVNPPDPFHAGRQELGFTSERFAPLEELPAEQEEAGELAGAGAGGGFSYN